MNFPKTTNSANAHDWGNKWGHHTQIAKLLETGSSLITCFTKKAKRIFLKNCNFIQKVDEGSTRSIKIEQEFVYEYDETKILFMTDVETNAFTLPKWRLPTEQIP